jgi:DMSO/TMAO reductase YedYZ molybdopterin-dependent catalytic subunit/thiosulfate reductase cytochrome b subunit
MIKRMIAHLGDRERKFLYPEDRRLAFIFKPYVWVILAVVFIAPVTIAWIQYLVSGLPADPSLNFPPEKISGPRGFPAWIRIAHWANFLFLTLIIRSGLSILMDHPRLYFNAGCRLNSEWLRFTPVKVPKDKIWTAKDDARYISPVIGLPGYRHSVGLARNWHFLAVPFFILNGVIFVILLFTTNQWERLVPRSWQIIPDSWKVFVHYVTFNFPFEPNGFFYYNALQQLAYFAVIFIMAPLAILTGLAMSPAIDSRFHWYPRLFGNRQAARSVHFLVMIAYVAFIIVHVTLVVATGFSRNMNHIIFGTNNLSNTGLLIGIFIILFVTWLCYAALWISWHRPRSLQRTQKGFNETLWKHSMNLFKPRVHYTSKHISPYFWPNGNMPASDKWKQLAATHFKDYKLKVGGLVENPAEFSIDELKAMAEEETITLHHCIQGWSGIAEWKGIPLTKIIEKVKPLKEVQAVAFYSFGEGLYGGIYYDTHSIENCKEPGSILAWEMNYQPLSIIHGAPLRLRIENQLGYKMVKWIESIEFITSPKTIGKGFGGKNEDDEYFDLVANI